MNMAQHNDLVELQARVIIIKSYVQFLLQEAATMPQYHVVVEASLAKLQQHVQELEILTHQLCETAASRSERRLPTIS